MKTRILCAAAAAFALALPASGQADETASQGHMLDNSGMGPIQAHGPVPIGVMGDHMHRAGQWMISVRATHMRMAGNRVGTDGIDPSTIVTTVPNRFFGIAGQPPTLRIVPLNMTTDMVMFGAMYAPSDDFNLMVMAPWIDKEMEAATFAGAAGDAELGRSTMSATGWGDVRASGLVRLWDENGHHAHINLGLGIPTGSIDNIDTMLAPNGTLMTARLPYAMQLGSGTWDLLPGLTYTGRSGSYGWGAQAAAVVRTGNNSAGYRLGDEQQLSIWGSHAWAPWISNSVWVTGRHVDSIHGLDTQIVAPVQGANPDYYGGNTVNVGFGIALAGQGGLLRGQRLDLTLALPVYQDLNGPQLEADYAASLNYKYAW